MSAFISKEKRPRSNAQGNRYLLNIHKKRRPEEFLPKKDMTDFEILGVYTVFKCGCKLSRESNCVYTQLCDKYSNDVSKLYQVVRSCENEVKFMTEREKREWTIEKFKNSMKSESSVKRLDMEYSVTVHGIIYNVCKKAFAKLYNISIHQLELCSKATKNKCEASYIERIKSYDDRSIPEYTYAQTKYIMEKNIEDFSALKGIDNKYAHTILNY
jgi:hypothetical protein